MLNSLVWESFACKGYHAVTFRCIATEHFIEISWHSICIAKLCYLFWRSLSKTHQLILVESTLAQDAHPLQLRVEVKSFQQHCAIRLLKMSLSTAFVLTWVDL